MGSKTCLRGSACTGCAIHGAKPAPAPAGPLLPKRKAQPRSHPLDWTLGRTAPVVPKEPDEEPDESAPEAEPPPSEPPPSVVQGKKSRGKRHGR
jgi:hypothetical protein